jgi:hypothetical protein
MANLDWDKEASPELKKRLIAAMRSVSKSTKDWNEEDHPRAEDGKFGEGGGSGSAIDITREQGGATLPTESGGGSVRLSYSQPSSGFAVATGLAGRIVPAAAFFNREQGVAAIDKFLEDNAQHFADPAHHLGLWHDEKSGNVFLDITEVFPAAQREEAISAGRDRDQISVWDLGEKVEIPTGGTGGL